MDLNKLTKLAQSNPNAAKAFLKKKKVEEEKKRPQRREERVFSEKQVQAVVAALIAKEVSKLPKPKDGKSPTREELKNIIIPLMPVIRQPKDGRVDQKQVDQITNNILKNVAKDPDVTKAIINSFKENKVKLEDIPEFVELKERVAKLADNQKWMKTPMGGGYTDADVRRVITEVGGAGTFVGLTDTPANYSGAANKTVKVNAGGTALEFVEVAAGGDVVGPAGATNEHIAQFDGTTGKLLKGGVSILDEDDMSSNSNTAVPTQQSVKAYVDSTGVTLAGTGTYISIAGQVITVDPITESDISDLGSYITDITGSPLSELSDVTITTIATDEVLKWNGSAWINQTLAEAGISAVGHTHTASEVTDFDTEVANNSAVTANTAKISYTDAAKVATIETNADVTDTANVTAAGALMDSEVTNLAQVKAFDTTDYATAAQGTTADSAIQPAVGEDLTDVQAIFVDATPDTDHTATGLTTDTINAGATIAVGELCYLASDGEWALADASATGTADKLLAISVEAGTDGASMEVALPGSFVRDDTWAWTVGARLFMSETAGDLTETAPTTTDSVVRPVGYAISADVVFFQPEAGIIHV